MKIAFLVSRVPYPLEKGDKLRAYHQLKHLSKTNEVHLICLNDGIVHEKDIEHLKTLCASVTVHKLAKIKLVWRLLLAAFSRKPYQVHYFYDKTVAGKIERQLKQINPDHIYCQLIRTTEYVKNLHEFQKTLDYMDAFSKGMQRRIEREGFIVRQFVKAEANRLTAYENLIFDYFDHKTIISDQDRDLIYHKNRKEIVVIPNGVDEILLNDTSIAEKKYDVLFHGNLSYTPNVDCVKYMVNEVMPLLVKFRPGISVAISGANPSAKVTELCKKFPENITLLGFVENIIPTYKSARIFFAPLQIGTGLQNKILEAMALKIPCVTSELCNNALNGENGKHLITAKKPVNYVNAIVNLLDNPVYAQQVAIDGHAFISTFYSWEKGNEQLSKLFEKNIAPARQ
ncbi:MAG TPA: glycosyltransferase [Flavobacteriales bacterium]|nr:glycosyltransferase [Flavobacteriales bacterium]